MSFTPKVSSKASALFTPHELRQYTQWRFPDTHAMDGESVRLPTAFEYADYLAWQADQRVKQRVSRNSSPSKESVAKPQHSEDAASPDTLLADEFVLAEHCRHPLHPGHPGTFAQQEQEEEGNQEEGEEQGTILWCPMCTLQIHLKLLAELWEKWLTLGGPWRMIPPGTPIDSFVSAKRAYYQRKVDMVNDMDDIEDIARLEAEWDVAHPTSNVNIAKPYSAAKAIETYSKNISFPALLADASQITPRTPPRTGRKKRLSYSLGTPEDTRHRANGFYYRHCTAYDPESPHACPDDEGWAETSFKNDWEYNVRQCRLLLCDKDPSLPDVIYRELTEEQHKEHLIEGLKDWFERMEPDWVQSWINNLVITTDTFIVWKVRGLKGAEDAVFNNWDQVPTLVGTNLEAHARQIGDVDEEDVEQHVPIQPVEMRPAKEDGDEEIGGQAEKAEEKKDLFDQESLASESSSEEEEEEDWADPMDLEEGDDDRIAGVTGGEEWHDQPE